MHINTLLSFRFFVFLFFLKLAIVGIVAQEGRKEKLEEEKKQLQKEIKKINRLLFNSKTKKKTVLIEVENLTLKINAQNRLIRITNKQANQLTERIAINERTIASLKKELGVLKEDYTDMILNAYQSRSEKSRLMFLFSSKSFAQAYKRFQYMKQYASYRRKQGIRIEEKENTLKAFNEELESQKKKKNLLVEENSITKKELESEKVKQSRLIASLKRKEKSLAAEIRTKQKKAAQLNREIQRLIEEAIAASNKTAGSKKIDFVLTPEAKRIGNKFIENKGRLPWPVLKGVVIQQFGIQPHPVVKTTMIQSNGVTIATPEDTEARAVFEGKVISILRYKGNNPIVLIQHGNYISTYGNLDIVYVKSGDKVKTKEKIGKIFTNPKTKKTDIKFSLFKGKKPVNPKKWIYRL